MTVTHEWPATRIADLTTLWLEGIPTREIARRLGVSRNAVIGKAHRLHLPARPSPIKRSAVPKPPRPAPQPRVVQPLRIDRARTCCWPIGEPRSQGYRTCDAVVRLGKSYCAEHYALAYRRG